MKQNIYKILGMAAIVLLAQSCFTAKEYTRPEVKAENLYREQAVAQDSASLAELGQTVYRPDFTAAYFDRASKEL